MRVDLYQKSSNDFDVASYDTQEECLAEVLKSTSGCASGVIKGDTFTYYSFHVYPQGQTTHYYCKCASSGWENSGLQAISNAPYPVLLYRGSPASLPPPSPPPPSPPATSSLCMPSSVELTASGSGATLTYVLDGSTSTQLVAPDTPYAFTGTAMASHPLAVIAYNTNDGCAVTTSCLNGAASAGHGELYCTGSGSTFSFSAGCVGKSISMACYIHGPMGPNRLTVSSAC